MLSGIFNIYNCYVGEYLYRGPDFLKFQGKGCLHSQKSRNEGPYFPWFILYFQCGRMALLKIVICSMLPVIGGYALVEISCSVITFIIFFVIYWFSNNHTDKYTTNERDINGTQHKQNLLLFNFYPYNSIIDFLSNASN